MALTQISTQGIKDGTITGSDLATNVDLVDNQKLRLGNSNDLQIYHDGSNSYIQDTDQGNLFIEASAVLIRKNGTTENIAKFIQDGAVELYHDNSKKFYTTLTGAYIENRLDIGGANLGWSYPKPLNVQGSSGAILALRNWDTTTYAADTTTSIDFNLRTGNTGNQSGSCEIRAFKENGTNGNNARGLSFYTGANGGSPTERMRIDSSGNVGIGVTPISGQGVLQLNGGLRIAGSASASDTTGPFIFRTSGADNMVFATSGSERMRIDSSGNIRLPFANNSTGLRQKIQFVTEANFFDEVGYIAMDRTAVSSAPSDMVFATGTAGSATEKLRIDSSGDATFSRNLILEGGSNHAYPFIRLHSSAANVRKWTIYNGQPWNPDALLIYDTDEDNTAVTIETNKLGVNKGANSLTRNFEVGGTALITGNLEVSSGQITCGVHGTTGMQIINNGIFGTLHSANLTFRTVSSSRMVIDTNGNVGAPSGSNIHNASDIRLKKNITTLDKGLEAVKSLRPVSFNWIDGFCDDEKETLYGFIAQEVETVDSNLVQEFGNSSVTVEKRTIDSVLRVNEKFIIPMLVKAVQELTAKVEALETEVAALKAS